jgi:hypothetical protein
MASMNTFKTDGNFRKKYWRARSWLRSHADEIRRRPFVWPNAEYDQSRRERLAISILVALSTSVVTLLSVAHGTFFDDEIFSIESLIVPRSTADMVIFFSTHDLHPAGSYVIFRTMFELLGSWSSVKDAMGFLNGVALGICVWQVYPKLGTAARRLFAAAMATSGTVVLMGDSLRWYALFDPVFLVALTYVIFSDHRPHIKITLCGISCIILFYLSYLGFLAAVVLAVAVFCRHYDELTRRDIKIAIIVGGVSICACIPQIYLFVAFHLQSINVLPRPLWSLLNVLMILVVGYAVFPMHYGAIAFVVLLAGTGIYYALYEKKGRLDVILIVALIVGALLLIVTGLGELDRRTAIFLYPFALLLTVLAVVGLPRYAREVSMGAVLLFQLISVWNVVWHVDTIKSSFNTDYSAALNLILEQRTNCDGALIVFDHDPVMTYLLEERNISVSSPFSRLRISTDMKIGDCVIQIKSNPGNFSEGELKQIDDATASDKLRFVGRRQFGKDPFHKFKHSEAGLPFSEYYLDILVFSVTDNWHGPELLEVVPGFWHDWIGDGGPESCLSITRTAFSRAAAIFRRHHSALIMKDRAAS